MKSPNKKAIIYAKWCSSALFCTEKWLMRNDVEWLITMRGYQQLTLDNYKNKSYQLRIVDNS